ncbi:hypothetical protein QR680_014312 [Steinernema hermaphroditum]|uniref:Uncharacterized protein n=1 Tax=Steinernema hermaphroditum TaxID=289476 RepID=A0AA39IA22_9BILA|nr:hypothetical protein QR680_014312 [Steinernema hermaphroditum]
MMRPFLIILLCAVPIFSKFQRTHKGEEPLFGVNFDVLSCSRRTQKYTLITSVGYVDSNGKLIYALRLEPKKYFDEKAFNSTRRACAYYAEYHYQEIYEHCFHPNIVHFAIKPHGKLSKNAYLKIANVVVYARFYRNRELLNEYRNRFEVTDTCKADRICLKGNGYLVKDGRNAWSKYLPMAKEFKIGNVYPPEAAEAVFCS